MYHSRAQLLFTDILDHINVIADPATHSCKEVMVAVAYSWAQNAAAYPPMQYLLPGKDVTSMEQDLPDDIAILSANRKLERVAAFRQLQGLSHAIHCLTSGRLNIDAFHLPHNANLSPVSEDQVRCVKDGVAVLYNKRTQENFMVLPESIKDVPLLVIGLDQGSM